MNNSTYQEILVLKKVLLSYLHEFSSKNSKCHGSDLYMACQNIDLSFFHNKPSNLKDNIVLAKNIFIDDKHFDAPQYSNMNVSSDAKFFRGCIRISRS
jgi:hypothetical protein